MLEGRDTSERWRVQGSVPYKGLFLVETGCWTVVLVGTGLKAGNVLEY